MIIGIGTDILQIERLQAAYDRTQGRLAEKILGPDEMLVFKHRFARNHKRDIAFLATRFAAKEALYKALSPSHGLQWHEAEVINQPNGKPEFLFRGEIADLVDGAQVHLSLSHDAGIASAMVVLER